MAYRPFLAPGEDRLDILLGMKEEWRNHVSNTSSYVEHLLAAVFALPLAYMVKNKRLWISVGLAVLSATTLFLLWPICRDYYDGMGLAHSRYVANHASPELVQSLSGINVVVAIFYGRRVSVSILDCYLQSNLKRNGGIVDKVQFFLGTDVKPDLDYLDQLLTANPEDYELVVPPKRGYSQNYAMMDPDTLYIKIGKWRDFHAGGVY